MKKDTVYIDNDDEITSITDKVQSSKSDIVALVLPKRCTVLQSSVNMKILNRAANSAGKKVVLITSEAALLPVAGSAGLYVAKTLQSKPAIPPKPNYGEEEIDTVTDGEAEEATLDATKSIGELAGATALAAAVVGKDDEESPIELGDDPVDPADKKDAKPKKEKKNKKLVVPNFDSFRVKLFAVIGGIILLGILWYVATNVLPRAIITITTENKAIPVNITVTASPSAQSINVDGKIVPAQTKSMDKTETKKFTATGEKNVGEKATGEVTFTNCESTDPITVPAGSRITATGSGGYTFITSADVSVPGSGFSGGGKVCNNKGKANATVVASQSGSQYNISARSYAIVGLGNLLAYGGNMGGGTDKTVKVVSANDCDSAKNELLNTKTDAYKSELSSQLVSAGYTPLNDSFTVDPGKTSCAPDVGTEATDAIATVTFKASMTGVNTAALDQLVQAEVSKTIEGTQSIFSTGVKTATLTIKDRKTNGDVVFTLQTEAQTGIKQDPDAIAKSIAGKKSGETTSILRNQAGVSDVKVEYKPFWVSGTPKNLKHITVKFVNNGSK